jgi:hypothetical protein
MRKRSGKTDNQTSGPAVRKGELADDAREFNDKPSSYRLTAEQRAEVRLALKELDEGKFASQQELDALWRRAGLTA